MNIHDKKKFFLLFALFAVLTDGFSQQVGSDSPYGRYGFGVLQNQALGASEAMGGISYGLRRSQQVNPGNPASYSKLDSLTFVFDFGVSGQYSTLSDGTNRRGYYNGNLDYVAIQFPLFHKVGASIGLTPYSKTGYNFGQTLSKSNIIYQEIFRGTGGLSQLYFGAAYTPLKYLSVGANVSYLFGNFEFTNVSIPQTSTTATVGQERKAFSIRDLKYDFGVQLIYPIDNQKSLTLGAVYSPKLQTKSTLYLSEMLFDADPYTNPGQTPKEILDNDTINGQTFQLPHTFGLGIAYSGKNLLVGIDGTFQQWKGLSYPDVLDALDSQNRFNNTFRVNLGAEYVIDPYSRNFWDRIRFRMGVSYNNSYSNVNIVNPSSVTGESLGVGGFKEYGINFGLGLPLRDNFSGKMSMFNIGFSYNTQRPEKSYMIKQDMFKITLNMNVNELWFFKRQFD